MRRATPFAVLVTLATAALAAAAVPTAGPAADAPLLGFSEAAAVAERAVEAKFDAGLQAKNLPEWLKLLSAHPHHVGSPADKANAEWIAAQFKSWGYDTHLEEFRVLFPTPKLRVLEMTAPTPFKAALVEPGLKEDSTSGQAAEQLPTYNAFSVDGDVTAELVYVNFGLPRDYEVLAEHGVDVKGKIVIARYGASWRGIKPKVAAEHGALGCIIYSDPHEDGYFEGDVYPRGAYRNERGVQRGSVADMPLYSGDPLTPGVGATADAKRLAVKDAPTLTKIPVLPISYADAQPLLRALGGPVVPAGWRGALPLTYHFGPGPARVHLKVEFDWSLKPIYDVIAQLPGAERPDEWILRGNHHDGWVNGAQDPLSGQVAMLEEARGIAALVKAGWRPRRTIVYAAWDGEEPGLLGSTEFVETHADMLREKAAVYINSDSNGRGFLEAAGSHSLERFVNQVARDVTDPEKGISVAERARAKRVLGDDADAAREARERPDLRIGALGSGSDFTPFLQHLGIAALDLSYGGEEGGGSYHSIYDSFDHYSRFGDPKWEYGITQAKTAGRAVLRLASADTLPFEFTASADTIARYAKEVEKLTDTLRTETEETNRRLREKTFEAVADPTEVHVWPSPKEPVPHLNFAPLENAVDRLNQAAKAYERSAADRAASGKPLPSAAQQDLDSRLLRMERALTRKEGLPGRPWYVHQIYAPGRYTGYGVKTLPAIREAIELRHWQEAEEQVKVVAAVIEGYAAEIDQAAAVWKAAP